MTNAKLDILAIGNAIVDVVAPVDHAFLSRHDLHPGSMRLIDGTTAAALYAAMPPGQESSGGSAANTAAIAAMLGARAGFLGKVADDQLGTVFRHDITAVGVEFPSVPSRSGDPTASCLILVTPDGQRTMNTFLGAAIECSAKDIDPAVIASAQIVYLEGYLFDPLEARAAFLAASHAARAANRKVALSLSDAFCVERHRAELRAFLKHVDILFANETEITSLYEVNSFEEAIEAARHDVKLAALTRSEAGSVIVHLNEAISIDAVPPSELVDSTGAGDAYAGGFLTAYTQGKSLAECGALASRAASAVLSQYGARPAPSAFA